MKARFFFALRPDPGAAAELGVLAARLAARLGGLPLSRHDVHLTLVFVGARPREDARTLPGLLAGIAPQWPALPLTRLGTFGRGLLWLGPDHPQGTRDATAQPRAAAAGPGAPGWPALLAGELGDRLHAAGVDFDRRPLHLHATLVRGARRDAQAAFPEFAGALPIAPTHWSLALGWSDADSTPHRRYRWSEAPG